jgi:hypothetical protein
MKVDFIMNYLRRGKLAYVNGGDLEVCKRIDSQSAEIGADIQAIVPKFVSEKRSAVVRDIGASKAAARSPVRDAGAGEVLPRIAVFTHAADLRTRAKDMRVAVEPFWRQSRSG